MTSFGERRPARFAWAQKAAKFLLLFIPWLFVAHGILVLQSHLTFFNNSVPTTARVVDDPTFSQPARPRANSRQVLVPEILKSPKFQYQHENGLTYVGTAIVTPFLWQYRLGELVEIRYDRLYPEHAQPVNFLHFWWLPTFYIAGGFLAFTSFALVLRPKKPKRRRYKNQHGTLKLRRD